MTPVTATGARRRPTEHRWPWTQFYETTSGGEAQQVRYHVALEGHVYHVILQFRPGNGQSWICAKRTICDSEYGAIATETPHLGMWCEGQCRSIWRAHS